MTNYAVTGQEICAGADLFNGHPPRLGALVRNIFFQYAPFGDWDCSCPWGSRKKARIHIQRRKKFMSRE